MYFIKKNEKKNPTRVTILHRSRKLSHLKTLPNDTNSLKMKIYFTVCVNTNSSRHIFTSLKWTLKCLNEPKWELVTLQKWIFLFFIWLTNVSMFLYIRLVWCSVYVHHDDINRVLALIQAFPMALDLWELTAVKIHVFCLNSLIRMVYYTEICSIREGWKAKKSMSDSGKALLCTNMLIRVQFYFWETVLIFILFYSINCFFSRFN